MSGSVINLPSRGLKKVEFTTPGGGTFNNPKGNNIIYVLAAGGGGGGGGSGGNSGTGTNAGGGGGSGSEPRWYTLQVAPDTAYSLTVGTGGSAGAAGTGGGSGTAGGNGGTTTLSNLNRDITWLGAEGGLPNLGTSIVAGVGGSETLHAFFKDVNTNAGMTASDIGAGAPTVITNSGTGIFDNGGSLGGAAGGAVAYGPGGGGGSGLGVGGNGGDGDDFNGQGTPGGNGGLSAGGGGGGGGDNVSVGMPGGAGGNGFIHIYYSASGDS